MKFRKKKTFFQISIMHAQRQHAEYIQRTQQKRLNKLKKFDVEGDSVQFRTFLVIQAVQTSTEEN